MKAFVTAGIGLILLYAQASWAQPSSYTPPPASAPALEGIPFMKASPLDEAYRAEFDHCDQEDVFKDAPMNGFRKCSTDPNHAKALLRFPNGTVFFESKLSLDIDGSWKACHDPGLADQCPTWFRWNNLPAPQRYVDPDIYPFVVIPIAGTHGENDTEFRDKTGIRRGDLGVVVYKDKVILVFVADGGPHNKLGEGSSALFKALGEDRCRRWSDEGHCERYRDFSISRGVCFFLFPGSKIEDLTPGNALEKIRSEARARFDTLKRE